MTQYEMLKALINGDTLVEVNLPRSGIVNRIRLVNHRIRWIECDNGVGAIVNTIAINGELWKVDVQQEELI